MSLENHNNTYSGSTLAVASSSTRILLFLRMALAKQINCRWPTLKLLPLAKTSVCSPAGPVMSFSSTDANALHKAESAYSSNGSKFLNIMN